MIWALLSIGAGLSDAISYSLIKKLRKIDVIVKLAMYMLMALPFILFGFILYDIPIVSLNFYFIVLINVAVFVIGLFILMKSLEISELSISIPMLSFTPIFLLLISYIMLRELPTITGFAGIIFVVLGSYIINVQTIKKGIFEPFKIFKNKGVFYMLIVAFLFSISANLTKIGVIMSNPVYFVFFTFLFASVILVALFFRKLIAYRKSIIENSRHFLLIGIVTALSELLATTAFNLTIVPYVISLKRTSILFSVLFGFLFFKEKNFNEKIAGTLLMFIGATLIILS